MAVEVWKIGGFLFPHDRTVDLVYSER